MRHLINHERRLIDRLAAGRSTAVLLNRNDHSTHKCYVAGCRCDPCTDAEASYSWGRKLARRATA